jgi:transcriptional regulator
VFIPPPFRVEDRETLYAFMERYGFATLVSDCGGVPFASHVPLLLDRDGGVLLGHLARGNPQWEAFGGAEALAVFSGPHAYVSPSWYAAAPAVPTWNYAAVHAYGTPRLLPPDRTREVVDRTVRKYEAGRPEPWPNDLPEEYRRGLLAGVVGFEVPITRVEGKFKLGQNRLPADQAGMLAGLRGDGVEAELLAAFIVRHHAGRPDAVPGTVEGR